VTDTEVAAERPASLTPWERFCHGFFIVFVLLPVALGLWVRDGWRRWFARFPTSFGHAPMWFTQDGGSMTTKQYIDLCQARGGEDWYFRERFHWQVHWPDGQRVSTIFMGLDHNMGSGPWAVLWETMVFGPYGTGSGSGQRYTRRIDAAVGHWKWVGIVQFYRLKAALRREPRLKPPAEETHD
jgi:hypothetical protein